MNTKLPSRKILLKFHYSITETTRIFPFGSLKYSKNDQGTVLLD